VEQIWDRKVLPWKSESSTLNYTVFDAEERKHLYWALMPYLTVLKSIDVLEAWFPIREIARSRGVFWGARDHIQPSSPQQFAVS
jgi:hypothetical protein